MRKHFSLAILLLALALNASPLFAVDSNSDIIIDGTKIAAKSSGNLLPLRDIIEQTNGTVTWNGSAQQVIVRRGSHMAVLSIGSTRATVNGREVELTIPPQLIGGRTMVSLCFLADHLGLGAGHKNNSFILSTVPASRIPVLVYHHILPDEANTHFRDNAWTISTENFAEQMRYLRDNGFYTPTLDELEAFLHHGRPLPQNSVMIHFDDGYYSNYVYALPILRRYGLRAVLFPITGDAEALGDVQPPMNYAALTRAAAITLTTGLDVFETASHSHALHDRTPDGRETMLVVATHGEIVADTLQSFELVTNRRAYAYPLGMFNDTVIAALQEAGITMAFTVRSGYITAGSDPFRLERFTVYRETSMARFRNIVHGRA